MSANKYTPTRLRSRLVLAYADPAHASQTCRQLRRHGWEVHLANNGADARRLLDLLDPDVLVLDTELYDESGWLACAKAVGDGAARRVILLASSVTDEMRRFARFVGASALVDRNAGTAALVGEVVGLTSLSVSC
jgi:DNA-binding response OmpR family regulator